MEIDLHCNIPGGHNIPNPAIGYLKGYFSMNNIKTRGFYWNILPQPIMDKIINLSQELVKVYGDGPVRFWMASCISRFLFSHDEEEAASVISQVFPNLPFPVDEFKTLARDLDKFIDQSIEDKGMANVKIAGFTMKLSQWLLNYYVIRKLKERNPDIIIVIGGMNTQSEAMEYMKIFKEVDFAIWGEGEVPFVKLTENLDAPSSYGEIPNLIYRKDGENLSTRQICPEDLPDIEDYPFADHSDYFDTLEEYGYHITTAIPIWGIRSCSWGKCKFCVLNEGYQYRERTPENIVQEMEYQTEKHGTDCLLFVDTDIGRKKREEFDRLLELLADSVMRRSGLYNIMGAEITPQRLDRKSISLLKRAGFDGVQIGFEAASDSLLAKINKKHRFIHNLQALKLSEEQRLGLTGLNIIRGTPSETIEDIEESMENLKFLRFLLDKYPLFPIKLALNKGSPYYMEMPSEQITSQWNNDPYNIWPVMKGLDFMADADKREFSGFHPDKFVNHQAWQDFGSLLGKHLSQGRSYTWLGFSDGSSIIEEREISSRKCQTVTDTRFSCGHRLNKVQTSLLSFCDTIKTFSQLKDEFSDMNESDIKQLSLGLKEKGILYFDDDFHMFLSMVSVWHKKPYEFNHDICIKNCITPWEASVQ